MNLSVLSCRPLRFPCRAGGSAGPSAPRGRWLAAAFALFCALHVVLTAGWIFAPCPAEYREWAHVAAARTMAAGGSPYEPGFSFYLYGPLFPAFGALWERLTGGPPLVFLRLLAYLFTWATALLAASEVWRRSGSRLAALAGAAVLLCCDWLNVTGSAHPAPLGVFLLLATLVAADRGRPVLAAVLTVAAFYVKPYFLAVLFPVALFFLLTSRRRLAVYALTSALVGTLSVLLVRALFPYFFVFNVVHHFNMATFSLPHLGRQLAWLSIMFLPLGAVLLPELRRGAGRVWRDVYFLAALALFLVCLRLAGHVGAFLSYAYQLWLPPLAVCAFSAAAGPGLRRGGRCLFFGAVLFLTLGVGSVRFNLVLPPSASQRAAWERARADVCGRSGGRVASFSPLFQNVGGGSEICSFNNGETEYAPSLCPDRPLVARLFPEARACCPFSRSFGRRVEAMLASGRWPVVVTDDWAYVSPAQLSAAGYREAERVTVRVGVHDVAVSRWELPASSAPAPAGPAAPGA